DPARPPSPCRAASAALSSARPASWAASAAASAVSFAASFAPAAASFATSFAPAAASRAASAVARPASLAPAAASCAASRVASPVALAASSIFLPAVSAGPFPVSERQPPPTSATPPASTSTVANRLTVRVMGFPFPGPWAPAHGKTSSVSHRASGTAPEARDRAVGTQETACKRALRTGDARLRVREGSATWFGTSISKRRTPAGTLALALAMLFLSGLTPAVLCMHHDGDVTIERADRGGIRCDDASTPCVPTGLAERGQDHCHDAPT